MTRPKQSKINTTQSAIATLKVQLHRLQRERDTLKRHLNIAVGFIKLEGLAPKFRGVFDEAEIDNPQDFNKEYEI
jgi:hypothetical protein